MRNLLIGLALLSIFAAIVLLAYCLGVPDWDDEVVEAESSSVEASTAESSAVEAQREEGSLIPTEILMESLDAEAKRFVVLLVDTEGSPVTDVELIMSRAVGNRWEVVRRERSDRKGRVVIPYFGVLPPAKTSLDDDAPALVRLVWSIPGAFKKKQDVEVDPDSSPERPQKIVLPPIGDLLFDLKGPSGETLPAEVRVALNQTYETRRGDGSLTEHTVLRSHALVPVAASEMYRLRPVEIGLALKGRVVPPWDGPYAKRDLDEPALTLAESSRVISVHWDRRAPLLTGRLLDSDQKALAHTEVDVDLIRKSKHGRATHGGYTTTDAEGTFRSYRREITAVKANESVSILIRQRFKDRNRMPLEYRGDVTASIKTTGAGLGDLILGLPPVLLKGRVFDTQGKGVEGAVLVTSDFGNGIVDLEKSYSDLWVDPISASGEFTIRGGSRFRERSTMSLSARGRGFYIPELRKVEDGEKDLRLILPEAGSLRLAFRVAAPHTLKDFAYCLKRVAGQPRVRYDSTHHPIPSDGVVAISDLPPGNYTAQAMSLRGNRLQSFGEFKIEAARETEVGVFDITETGFVYELKIVDGGGDGIEGVSISGAGTRRRLSFRGAASRRGEIKIRHAEEALLLRLRAVGYQTLSREIRAGQSTITMARGPLIRLELPGARQFLREGESLLVELRDKNGVPTHPGQSFPVPRSDDLSLQLREPGRYEVILKLKVPLKADASALFSHPETLPGSRRRFIKVTGRARQTIRVEVEATLQDSLRQARQKILKDR